MRVCRGNGTNGASKRVVNKDWHAGKLMTGDISVPIVKRGKGIAIGTV